MTTRSSRPNPDTARPGFVASLAKGLEVLAAFERGDLLGNQELAARTGLPKATVSRLTGTLAALGYLRLDERTRKYRIGARVLGLGASVQRHIGLQRVARPTMEALAQELDLTVILATRERLGMVFLEIVRPPRNVLTVNTDAGSVVRLETTSLGLAYLAAAPVAERVRLLEALQREHPGDWDELRKDVERAHREREQSGFVISQRSHGGALSGVSVPLDLGTKGLFTLTCTGPSQQVTRRRLTQTLGPRLEQAVAEIREALARTRLPLVVPPHEQRI